MEDPASNKDAELEVSRLLDEIEQLRTALESSSDEMARLAADRDRLLRRLTDQARELQAANASYLNARTVVEPSLDEMESRLQSEQDQQALRIALEEMQVLTEELEASNTSLQHTNEALDERVEERTRELETKNAALAYSERRFRTLVEGIPQLVWRAVGVGEWTWASPQWVDFTGLDVEQSRSHGWLAALHPDDRKRAERAWMEAAQLGQLEMEVRVQHAATQQFHWFQVRATPVRDDAGAILEWLGTCTDIDQLRELQERQSVLVAELQHRTRNLIGVVTAVSRQTANKAQSLDDFDERFSRRMGALSRVQGLLSRQAAGQRVSFSELLDLELAALGAGDDKVTLHGPAGVLLRSSTVQILSLALHELATNAVKYGALSGAGGHITIRWRVIAGHPPSLHVDWRESGVALPQVEVAPSTGGYGRDLIEKALPYQLDATTSYAMTADGVHCTIELPILS